MGVFKTLWGLLVDDRRLASIIVVSLIVAFGVSRAGLALMAALVIWLGLIVSLWVSVDHQLQIKRREQVGKAGLLQGQAAINHTKNN